VTPGLQSNMSRTGGFEVVTNEMKNEVNTLPKISVGWNDFR